MSELKTLKDIDCCHAVDFETGETCICTDLKEPLRQEAIKWIKEVSRRDGLCYSPEQFIKHFFNVTDEDLHPKKKVFDKHGNLLREEDLK